MTPLTAVLVGATVIFLPIILGGVIYFGKKINTNTATTSTPSPAPPIKKYLPHILVGTVLVTGLGFTYYHLQPSLFILLVAGGGAMWTGKKMTSQATPSIKTWGSIIRGLGMVILLFAVMNSGVRVVAEKAIIATESFLKGETSTSEDGVTLPRFMSPSDTEEVLMGGAPVGTTENRAIPVNGSLKVHLGVPRQKSEGSYWPCLKAKGGFEPPLQFEVVRGAYTAVNTLKLTEESFLQAHRMGVKELNVVVVKAAGSKNPCPQHLKAQ